MGCVDAGFHILGITSNSLFVCFARRPKCLKLLVSSSSTHAEEIFRNKAVALFPITKFDLPDLQIIPQVENIIDGLLWHRCWYIRSIAQCPENIDKVLGIFIDKEDSVLVKLLLNLSLNYICQP